MNFLDMQPRSIGLLGGTVAVGLGLFYLFAAGAPANYLIVNFAALVLGASLWLALGRTARSPLAVAGPVALLLSSALLATALFGTAVDGASRWVAVAGLTLQVSLIVLPLLLVLYTRRPDTIGTAAMMIAALALAIQPDRAMAGVLLVGSLALLVAKPGRLPGLAVAASVLAFGWTLFTPDTLPAVPFVDRILYTAFDVNLLAGLAVVVGSFALLLPALLGLAKSAADRPVLLAFGGCWAAIVGAAALGHYPTPLVGYGGSAVLGYLLSVALLPSHSGKARRSGVAPSAVGAESPSSSSGTERRIADLA